MRSTRLGFVLCKKGNATWQPYWMPFAKNFREVFSILSHWPNVIHNNWNAVKSWEPKGGRHPGFWQSHLTGHTWMKCAADACCDAHVADEYAHACRPVSAVINCWHLMTIVPGYSHSDHQHTVGLPLCSLLGNHWPLNSRRLVSAVKKNTHNTYPSWNYINAIREV